MFSELPLKTFLKNWSFLENVEVLFFKFSKKSCALIIFIFENGNNF